MSNASQTYTTLQHSYPPSTTLTKQLQLSQVSPSTLNMMKTHFQQLQQQYQSLRPSVPPGINPNSLPAFVQSENMQNYLNQQVQSFDSSSPELLCPPTCGTCPSSPCPSICKACTKNIPYMSIPPQPSLGPTSQTPNGSGIIYISPLPSS